MRRTLLMVVGVFTALVLSACSQSGGRVVSAAISVPATDSRVATVDGLAVMVGEIERELHRSRSVGSADQALEENARRKAALRKGEAVFGPIELEPGYYFGYHFDTEVIAFKERLQADELRASDTELCAFYESVKARFLNEGTDVTADFLTFVRGTGDAEQRAHETSRPRSPRPDPNAVTVAAPLFLSSMLAPARIDEV